MTVNTTELLRRKTIAALQIQGGFLTTEDVCNLIAASWLTAKRHLNDLVSKGFARKRGIEHAQSYMITRAGTLEYRKFLKIMEGGP